MKTANVWVYVLQCADRSYYVGKYQGDSLETRVAEHNTRKYTARRLPVRLVWSDWFSRYDDAVAFERRLKGWSRPKKEALIAGDDKALRIYSRRGFHPSSILRDARPAAPVRAPQDEGEVPDVDEAYK